MVSKQRIFFASIHRFYDSLSVLFELALNLPFLICTCSVWDSYVICPNSNKVKIWLKKLHLPKLQRLLPRFYVTVAIAMPRSLLLEVHFRSVRKRKSSLMVKGIHKVIALFLCFPTFFISLTMLSPRLELPFHNCKA